MKTKCCLYVFLTVSLFAGIVSTGFAQSNNCTVMDNQKGLVTVSCPGEGPKTLNLGGSADIYKPGDSITVTGPAKTTGQGQEVRPGVR
jgi:hypothetical protein